MLYIREVIDKVGRILKRHNIRSVLNNTKETIKEYTRYYEAYVDQVKLISAGVEEHKLALCNTNTIWKPVAK